MEMLPRLKKLEAPSQKSRESDLEQKDAGIYLQGSEWVSKCSYTLAKLMSFLSHGPRELAQVSKLGLPATSRS